MCSLPGSATSSEAVAHSTAVAEACGDTRLPASFRVPYALTELEM